MVLKKCRECGKIIPAGEICEECEIKIRKEFSTQSRSLSIIAGLVIIAVVLIALRISGTI